MKFIEHKITSIVLMSFLPFLATAQDIHELFRIPVEKAGELKVGVAIESKKKPKVMVLGADGNIHIREDESWNQYPLGINAEDKQYLLNKKGDMYVTAREGDGIAIWESKDLGESWARTGEFIPATRPAFYTAHTDMKAGDIYILFTTTDGEGENCKSSVWMVSSGSSGKKWSDPLLLNNQPASCNTMMASMTSFRDGKMFGVWTDGQSFQVDRTYDGKTWLRNDINITSEYRGTMKYGTPRLLLDNSDSRMQGMMYISGVSSPDSVSRVWVRKSGNLGDAWTSNVLIDKAYEGDQYFPHLAIDHEVGALYATWIGMASDSAEVWFAYSLDAGQKFTAQKLSSWKVDPKTIESWVQPVAVAAYDGQIVVTWLENSGAEVIQKMTQFSQKELFSLPK